MTTIGKLVLEVDEDGEDVPPGGDGGPPTVRLLEAIDGIKPNLLEGDQKKFARKLKRAAKALVEMRGDVERAAPGWAAGTWLAATAGARENGDVRIVAVVTMVHGNEIIGWQTRGPDEDGAVDFDPILRGDVRSWGLASDVDPVIVDAAAVQGLA